MPRPPRCRRICGVPQVDTFCPNGCENTEPILLTLDEYEVIRLVDLEQRTHEQCATQMDISRSTVQEIYESARSKILFFLFGGIVGKEVELDSTVIFLRRVRFRQDMICHNIHTADKQILVHDPVKQL